jgi:hypothetical protein
LCVVAGAIIEISRRPAVGALWILTGHAPTDRFVHINHRRRRFRSRTRDADQPRVEVIVPPMQFAHMWMSVLRAALAAHDGINDYVILNAFVYSIRTMPIRSTLNCIVHHPLGGENELPVIAATASPCIWILAPVVDAARTYR